MLQTYLETNARRPGMMQPRWTSAVSCIIFRQLNPFSHSYQHFAVSLVQHCYTLIAWVAGTFTQLFTQRLTTRIGPYPIYLQTKMVSLVILKLAKNPILNWCAFNSRLKEYKSNINNGIFNLSFQNICRPCHLFL